MSLNGAKPQLHARGETVMVGITTYTSLPSSRLAGSATGAAGQTQDVSADGKTSTTPPAGSTSTVSNLARQLGEAAEHAEARDASLSRKEMGQIGRASCRERVCQNVMLWVDRVTHKNTIL